MNRPPEKRAPPTKIQIANRALVAKKYAVAIRFFEEHADEVPSDYAKCHTKIAECLRMSNALAKPVTIRPGVELVSEGDREGAERHYRLALDMDSSYSPALLGLAELLRPQSDERLKLLERAADAGPTYLGLVELGDFYRSVRKELGRAHATYLQAMERKPRDGTAYQKLQDVCRRMGKDDEAREWSRKWKAVYATKKRVDGRGSNEAQVSEFDEVKAAGRLVLNTLCEHKPGREYTASVEAAMQDLDDPARRLRAVKALCALSHPKALGDLFVEQVPGFEWPNMVSRLSGAAGDYIRKFDPNVPVGRELGFSQEELAMLTKSTLATHSHDSPDTRRLPFGRGWSSIAVFVAKFILLPVAFVAVVLLLVK